MNSKSKRGQKTTIMILIIAVIILIGIGGFYSTFFSNDSDNTKISSPTPKLNTPPTSSTAANPKSTTSNTRSSTPTGTLISTSTSTPPTTSVSTTEEHNEFKYQEFAAYLEGEFQTTSTPLRIMGGKVFKSNATFWIVYNGTDAKDNSTARQLEWGEFARSYAFALRSHEQNNASGEVPARMRVIEANTSENNESTFIITKEIARKYAYNNISDGEYTERLFQTLRTPTEQEQRIAQRIDSQTRDVTFFPNGTWDYTEPAKKPEENSDGDSSASVANKEH